MFEQLDSISGRWRAGVEMGFISAGGEAITPDIAYLPADLPTGVWLRSSEIDVPAAMVMDTEGGSAAG